MKFNYSMFALGVVFVFLLNVSSIIFNTTVLMVEFFFIDSSDVDLGN